MSNNLQLLSIIVPKQLGQNFEDFLLSNQNLVDGFTSIQSNGHGSAVTLVEPSELVSGHSPRLIFNLIGQASNFEKIIELAKIQFRNTNIYFYRQEILQAGRL